MIFLQTQGCQPNRNHNIFWKVQHILGLPPHLTPSHLSRSAPPPRTPLLEDAHEGEALPQPLCRFKAQGHRAWRKHEESALGAAGLARDGWSLAGPPDGGETGLGPMPRNKKKKKKKEQPLDTTRDPVVPCEKVICSTL